MKCKTTHILFAIIACLTASLLVGMRMDWVWAGGTGTDTPVDASLIHTDGTVVVDRGGREQAATAERALARGEIIKTSEDGQALVEIKNTGIIGLHYTTEVRLDRLTKEHPTITLHGGRIMVERFADAPLALKTHYLTIDFKRTTRVSVINFAFLGQVKIIPFDGEIMIRHDNGQTWRTSTPITIHELPPATTDSATFNIQTDPAADFYRWYESSINHQ